MSAPLALRRGRVVEAPPVESEAPQELVVEVAGEPREAISYPGLTGPVEEGDEVVVNTAARDLGLGSGGFDVVVVNLSRGLDGALADGPHAMKLNYSPLQHAVEPVERAELEPAARGPVAVLALHGQLAPVAWALAEARAGTRLGFVQTPGGALPGALSRTARELRARGLLCDHVTAGACFGGEREAITVAGALDAGFAELGWDAAVAGPGPGILGTETALGHGGLAALDSLHAALALGCPALCVPRMSSGDPRPRHRGLSHHTRAVLDLVLAPIVVAAPPEGAPETEHEVRTGSADLDGYRASGLSATTMGRSLEEDPLFFSAALAGGDVLAGMV